MLGSTLSQEYGLAVVALSFLFVFRYSIPFVWTVRVFRPYVQLRLNSLLSRLVRSNDQCNAQLVSQPAPSFGIPLLHGRPSIEQTPFSAGSRSAFPDVLSAQGCDPFADAWTWRHHVTMDECAINCQLSHSSYMKNLDVALMDFATHRLGDFIRDGGWMSLMSCNFDFHRDIPFMRRYTIVTRIESWTDDHLYLRNEFRGRDKSGDALTFCTSITKHGLKYGKKHLPPWFVLAYTGYSGACEATLIKTNANRSRDVRKQLKQVNPLHAFERFDPMRLHRKVPDWCLPSAWDVNSWEHQRVSNLKALSDSM